MVEEPELRLYYDEQGNVLFYTCEKLEGNYIVIDQKTYAEGRPDIKVRNGKILPPEPTKMWFKLTPSEQGIACSDEDVSVIAQTKDSRIKKWEVKFYELN